ncbi:MAG: AAA family ATPase [Oscillospiraceae bacterium]|jgi:DNA polymerase-3 subunit delta'|nr:AAA family ATPase [Oscillospiraceae bacterium]
MLITNLDEFVGNSTIKSQLARIFDLKNFPNSIMIEGESGLGKSTLSKIIATAAVCSSLKNSPCCKCKNCKKSLCDSHPDIIYLEKSGISQSFGVNEIRKVKKESCILPNEASFKIYIFEEADKMTRQAQNAILKLLEEPSNSTIFILTCNSAHSLINTLCSRCQIFSLSLVDIDLIIKFLKLHNPNASEEDLGKAAKISGGNIKKALDEIHSKTNALESNLKNMISFILEKNEWKMIVFLSDLSANKENFICLFTSFLLLLKKSAIIKISSKSILSQNEKEEIKTIIQGLELKKILSLIDIIEKILEYQKSNIDPNMLSAYFCTQAYSCINQSK